MSDGCDYENQVLDQANTNPVNPLDHWTHSQELRHDFKKSQ